jgi:hypothetical protein
MPSLPLPARNETRDPTSSAQEEVSVTRSDLRGAPIDAAKLARLSDLHDLEAYLVGLLLRDLDRALWARSYEQDLLELIGHAGIDQR